VHLAARRHDSFDLHASTARSAIPDGTVGTPDIGCRIVLPGLWHPDCNLAVSNELDRPDQPTGQ